MTIASFIRRLWREEDSGATAMEFALLLPALTYIIFGIVDIGVMMISSVEVNYAAEAAIRQVRTGAVQSAPVPSSYAGNADCTAPTTTDVNFVASATQNCIGFDIASGSTAQTIFNQLIDASVLDGCSLVVCTNITFNVTSYSSWADVTAALPSLSFNPDGTPSVSWASPTGSQIIVAAVGYKYYFFTPLIGCIFDATDCKAGKPPRVVVAYYAVVEAEPFGTGG